MAPFQQLRPTAKFAKRLLTHKTKTMKILKVTREEKYIAIRDEKLGSMSVENRDIEYHEAPLQSFDNSLQALKAVVKAALEVPEKWTEIIQVKSLSITYTKQGTRSAQIAFNREMALTGTTHRMNTPAVRIDDPADGEEGQSEVTHEHAGMIATMILEAEKYAEGERQQILLPLDNQHDTAEPQQGDVLDFETPIDGYHTRGKEQKDGPSKKKAKKTEKRTDWTAETIPFHPDTDIPNFSKMETQHAEWYIEQTDKSDLNRLQEEIRYNYGKKPVATTLAKLKSEAIKLLP